MITSIKHCKSYKVCRGEVYSMCGLCGVYLHCNPARGKYKGKTCFHDYHDDCFFYYVGAIIMLVPHLRRKNGHILQLIKQGQILIEYQSLK